MSGSCKEKRDLIKHNSPNKWSQAGTGHPASLGSGAQLANNQSLIQNTLKVCTICDSWIHSAELGHTSLSVFQFIHFKLSNGFLLGGNKV